MNTQSFSALKRSRNTAFDALSKEIDKQLTKKTFGPDDRFWSPTVDKAGNGFAVIRFLPAGIDEVPWVRYWHHAFKGPGGWYIENSLTTLDQPDPVSEYNTELWATGTEANKNIARKQKRKLTYITNIYVVKDPSNPDAEGKVFLYKFGKKIFDKLNEKMHPEFEDEEKINPFDLWAGANFKLKIRQADDYRNYDKSEFDDAGPLVEDESELEKIWNARHDLKPFVSPEAFKPYADLKKRFDRVMSGKTAAQVADEDADEIFGKSTQAPPWEQEETAPKTSPAKKPASAAAPKKKTASGKLAIDDEVDISFLEALANKD